MLSTEKGTSDISVRLKPEIENISAFFKSLFGEICKSVEQIDNREFEEQSWVKEDEKWIKGASRGDSIYLDRTLRAGNVFEKIGANYVAINGRMPPGLSFQKAGALATNAADQNIDKEEIPFFATGTSFVIHPLNPMVPTVHCNYRYIELGQEGKPGYWWFGGGADLTPSYLFNEDIAHFHSIHKQACDRHDPSYYPQFKKNCDDYFRIHHRDEGRGVGGIFFDQLNCLDKEKHFDFIKDCAESFSIAYMPIVERRKDSPFTKENKEWQQIVRGRYVEFILTSDRGAKFGLASGIVNPQSVFNCMPPSADWKYEDEPIANSGESRLKEVLKHPCEWV